MIPHIAEWVFLLRLFLEPRNQLTLQKPEAKPCSADLKGGLSLCSIAQSGNQGLQDEPRGNPSASPCTAEGFGGTYTGCPSSNPSGTMAAWEHLWTEGCPEP